MGRARRVGLILVAAALVTGVVLLGPLRSAALPPGATPLRLATQPWKLWPPSGLGCPMAGVLPIRVERDGDTLVFATVDDGERRPVVFPNGFSARLLNGRAELVYPDGSVLAREGDVIGGLAGSAADNGDIVVCFDLATKPQIDRAP